MYRNQAGQIWSVGKVDFTKSFVLRFDAYLGTNDNGADGIAAVFHNSPQGKCNGSNWFRNRN
jgi:hypothetical protein